MQGVVTYLIAGHSSEKLLSASCCAGRFFETVPCAEQMLGLPRQLLTSQKIKSKHSQRRSEERRHDKRVDEDVHVTC